MAVELTTTLSMCFLNMPIGQHDIGLMNVQNRQRVADDVVHFYVLAELDKRYVLRMINNADDVKVLLKRVPIHGFKMVVTNKTSDEFDECVSSKTYKLESMLPFLSPPVRTITEQYPGYMYDDILMAELNFIETLVGSDLISSDTYIGQFFHPSVCAVNAAKILLVSRGRQGIFKEIPVFNWITIFSTNYSVPPLLTINSADFSINFSNYSLMGREEPRCIATTSNTIHLTFTHPLRLSFAEMESSELKWCEIENVYKLSKPTTMKIEESLSQKNWVPFIYESTLFFVYQIVPLIRAT